MNQQNQQSQKSQVRQHHPHDDRQQNQQDQQDQALNRLLSALGSVQPGEDFAQRTLRAVTVRQSSHAPHSVWRLSPSPLRAISVCAAAALTLAAVVTMHAHKARPVPANFASTPSPMPAGPERAPQSSSAPHATLATALPGPRRAETILAGRHPPAEEQDPAYAPSMTAPPLPLTAQERLLLRAGRRETPTELAMLNSDELAQREAAETVQFNQFFPPPAKLPVPYPPVEQLLAPPAADSPGDRK